MKTSMLRTGAWLCALAGSSFGQSSIWIDPAFNGSFSDSLNWVGAGVPVDGGSAVIQIGGPNLHEWFVLPSTFSLNQIRVTGDDVFQIRGAAGGSTLTLGSGGIQPHDTSGSSMRLRIGSGVTLNLTGATTFNFGGSGDGTLVMSGVIAGTGPLTLQTGGFLLNRTSSGNTYSGGTVLGTAASGATVNAPVVTIWNSSPFGTGPVSIQNGAFIYGYAPSNPATGSVVTNALTLNASGSTTVGATYFRAADTKLEFSGAVTLAGNALLEARMMQANHRGAEGYLPVPGPFIRNPIVFSGNIGETGGARQVTFRGPSFFYLTGTNSWTGGTVIGQGGTGSVVFASSGSIPTTGTITVNAAGYAGVTDPANVSVLPVATNSQGAIGFDTPLGAGSPTIVNSSFSLAGFTDPSIRIGTATRAVIGSGATITPQGNSTAPYRFGNGGGTLYVQSAPAAPVSRGVVLSNANTQSPLRVFLQGGANFYTGTASADSGQLVFDSAIPGSGQTISVSGTGYVGATENAGLTPSQFLARIQNSTAAGTVGFDTAPTGTDRTTPATTPRTISDPIGFGGFGSNVYLGTTTSVILAGTITPSTADNTYRFTAARGGRLVVSSNLAANPVAVGVPGLTDQPTNGTVALTGTNAQTSTTLQGSAITLEAGSSGLGTGPLNLAPGAGGNTPVGLRAAVAGTTFANAINFQENVGASTYAGQLALGGGNAFTLAGNISGPTPTTSNNRTGGRIRIHSLDNPDITFSGDNSGYHGTVEVLHGSLTLASANAGGNARYFVDTANAQLRVTASTTLRSVDVGADANLRLADGITLTVDVTDVDDDRSFDIDGTLGGLTGFATTAALKVTGTVGQQTSGLYIAKAAGFTGGTTIDGA